MKKQLYALLSYVLIVSFTIQAMAPSDINIPAIEQEKKSLFYSISHFKKLYQKCRKPDACTPQEHKELQSKMRAIIAIGTGLAVVLLAGGTTLGLVLFKRRRMQQEVKMQQEAEEKNRREQEELRLRQEEQLRQEQDEKRRQELLAQQEEERRQLVEDQRKRDEQERIAREEQARQEQARIEQERIQREQQELLRRQAEEERIKKEEADRLQRIEEARLKAEQDELTKLQKFEEQARKQQKAARQKKMHQLIQKLKKELPLRVKTRGFYNQPKDVRQQMSTDMSARIRDIESAYNQQQYERAIALLVEGFNALGTSDTEKQRLGISDNDLEKLIKQ